MEDYRTEIAELRAALERQHLLLEEQQKRIGELESRTATSNDQAAPQSEPTRRQLFAGAAAAALGGAAVLASSSPAEAAGLNLGVTTNTAADPTGLAFTGTVGLDTYGIGVTDQGLSSFPSSAAVAGHTQGNFVSGLFGYHSGSGQANAGVLGSSTNAVGVAGQATGTLGRATGVLGLGGLRGVHGFAVGNGVKSIGVLADANLASATALAVKGVMRVTRAGRTAIPVGKIFRGIPLSPLTSTSLVLAMAQKVSGNVAVRAVTVKTTSPTAFTIWLSAPAPAGGMPVAWFVVDTMGAALS